MKKILLFAATVFLFMLLQVASAQIPGCCVHQYDAYGGIIGCLVWCPVPPPPGGTTCGDGLCQPPEDRLICPQDCAVCGDSFCDTGVGENICSCSVDCGPNNLPTASIDVCNYNPYTYVLTTYSDVDGDQHVKTRVDFGDTQIITSPGYIPSGTTNHMHTYSAGSYIAILTVTDRCNVATIAQKSFSVPYAIYCPLTLTCGDAICAGAEDSINCPQDCGPLTCYSYDPFLKNEEVIAGCFVPKPASVHLTYNVSSQAFPSMPVYDYVPQWLLSPNPTEPGYTWTLVNNLNLNWRSEFVIPGTPTQDFLISKNDWLINYGLYSMNLLAGGNLLATHSFNLIEHNRNNCYQEVRRARYLWWNHPVYMKWLHYYRINSLRLLWWNALV